MKESDLVAKYFDTSVRIVRPQAEATVKLLTIKELQDYEKTLPPAPLLKGSNRWFRW